MAKVTTQPFTGRQTLEIVDRPQRWRPHLALGISERRLFLVTADLLALNAALLLALWLGERGPAHAPFAPQPSWFVLLTLLWLPVAAAFDAYDLRVAARLGSATPAVLKSGAVTAAIYILIPYITPWLLGSRLRLIAFFAITLALLLAGRILYAKALFQPSFHRRTLVVGAGWAGRTIGQELIARDDGSYHIVGFVDDDALKRDTLVILDAPGGARHESRAFKVLGDHNNLTEIVVRERVTTLVVAITHELNGDMLQTLVDCLEHGVEIVPMPVLYERLTGRVPVEHVGGNWYVALPLSHAATSAFWPVLKRAKDVTIASLGLLALAFMLPLLALAIRLDSTGPIFYSQERVGKGGRRFRIYKLRSMVSDAERGGARWAQVNDSRVTRVGRFLRRTHVDEWPQLLNILRGEMSIVGPRPERPEFVERLADEIPFYRVRHAVKPGATGWGLVKQGYGASTADALLKLQYDLYYIKHQSLWLDLVILLKTVLAITAFRGR